jgi:hypothetical protein
MKRTPPTAHRNRLRTASTSNRTRIEVGTFAYRTASDQSHAMAAYLKPACRAPLAGPDQPGLNRQAFARGLLRTRLRGADEKRAGSRQWREAATASRDPVATDRALALAEGHVEADGRRAASRSSTG